MWCNISTENLEHIGWYQKQEKSKLTYERKYKLYLFQEQSVPVAPVRDMRNSSLFDSCTVRIEDGAREKEEKSPFFFFFLFCFSPYFPIYFIN